MTGRQEVFQKAIQQGHSAAWDQNWERAAKHYRQAVEEFPENPTALASLGLALYELERYDEALAIYSRATGAAPEDPIAFEKIAQISEVLGNFEQTSKASLRAAELYTSRGEADKVIENLTRVTRLQTENLAAHSRLAIIYERLGRKPQAVNEFIAIASLLQHRGEIDRATQAVSHALQISPESSEAHKAMAMIKESRPLPKPVRSSGVAGPILRTSTQPLEKPAGGSQTSSGIDPVEEGRQKAVAGLAGLIFEQPEGQPDVQPQVARRGLQAIMQGITLSPGEKQIDPAKIRFCLNQAVDFQTHAQNDKAADELEKAINAGLDHPAAYFDIGLIRYQKDRLETAARNLQHAVRHGDFALPARLLLGQTLRKMGRLNEATLEYLEALKLADSQVVPDDLADELQQLYEPIIEAESQQVNEEAKTRICNTVEGLLLRADWRERLIQARKELPVEGDDGPPIPLGEILCDARGGLIFESISVIHRLARAGFLRSAMEEAYYALQFSPTYLPLHIYMGDLLLQQDLLPEAIAKFTIIAQTYNSRGESKRAIHMLRRVIHVAPMDLTARARLIELLSMHGNLREAIQEYMEMAEVYYNLADLARAQQTYQEALRLAGNVKLEQSYYVYILHQMADIDLQSLDLREGLRVYEQIRSLQPEDQRARENLVEINLRLGQGAKAEVELSDYLSYLEKSGLINQAEGFIRKLISENPDQPFMRRNLAEILLKSGHRAEAVMELNSLGEYYIRSGDHPAAIEVLESLREIDPQNMQGYQNLLLRLRGA